MIAIARPTDTTLHVGMRYRDASLFMAQAPGRQPSSRAKGLLSVQIEVFSDVVCPWCYIGKRRLEEALDGFAHRDDVEVRYRSFQLDPSTPDDVTGTQAERLAEKYGIPVSQAEAMNARVSSIAAEAGLDFRLDRAHPANTRKAHRLLHLAAEQGKQPELKERLLAAHFSHGEDVGDTQTLVTAAEAAGLDGEAARTALANGDYADEFEADLALARAFGISSVPFFVVDRKYGIAGAQETAALREALEKAWLDSHPLQMFDAASGSGTAADGDAAENCADGACAV